MSSRSRAPDALRNVWIVHSRRRRQLVVQARQ
jgi:hypothetical protein